MSVIFDETPDVEGRCVLNILISPLVKQGENKIIPYLANTVFMDKCDHATVSQAVIKTLNDIGVDSENVVSFNTDNAAYMLKAFKTILTHLFPNSIHITCLSHIVNLIGESFKKPFDLVTKFLLYMSRIFYMAGGRKRRYLKFLNDTMPDSRPSMCPDPCATRWNSWFEAILYYNKHFHVYKAFIESEIELCSRSPAESLENLHLILQNKADHDCCKIQIAIIADKCLPMMQLTDLFQSHTPVTVKVYEYLEDLMINFTNNSMLTYEAMRPFFDNEEGDDMPLQTKKQIVEVVGNAYTLAMDKLSKYMDNGQPGLEFLKQCRLLNPKRLAVISKNKIDYTAIPGLQNISDEEFNLYVNIYGPAAVNASVSGIIDLDLFWSGMGDKIPNFSKIAMAYKDLVTSSADAERSNSLYKLILGARRRSLSEESLRALLFLYFNNNKHKITEQTENEDNDVDII